MDTKSLRDAIEIVAREQRTRMQGWASTTAPLDIMMSRRAIGQIEELTGMNLVIGSNKKGTRLTLAGAAMLVLEPKKPSKHKERTADVLTPN